MSAQSGVSENEMVETVSNGDEDALLVNPSTEFLDSFVERLQEEDADNTVRIGVTDVEFRDFRNDFLATARLADLVKEGRVELREIPEATSGGLLFTNGRFVGLFVSQQGMILTEPQDLSEQARDTAESIWEDGQELRLRTPPLSEVYGSLGDSLGEDVADDFRSVIESIGTFPESPVDAVEIFLLVAARNEELLYDISKWGEDAGVASKATFSRTKTKMEDKGYIQTEKVPIDIGRPRLRLKLAGGVEDSIDGIIETVIAG